MVCNSQQFNGEPSPTHQQNSYQIYYLIKVHLFRVIIRMEWASVLRSLATESKHLGQLCASCPNLITRGTAPTRSTFLSPANQGTHLAELNSSEALVPRFSAQHEPCLSTVDVWTTRNISMSEPFAMLGLVLEQFSFPGIYFARFTNIDQRMQIQI